jgi:Protein of unknown function (DUF2939)
MFNSLTKKLHDRFKSIDKKTAIVIAIAGTGIAAIAVGGIYYSPYQTISNMKNATENRNADALAQEIDFPELRVSIKKNVKAQVMKQMAGLATPEIVEKMVNPMVDKVITPAGIEQLMQDKVPGAKIDLSNLDRDLAKSDIKMGYESIDRFVVHITDKVDRTKDVSLILSRDGLVWKLSGIDISKV